MTAAPKIVAIAGGGFAFVHPCSVCGTSVAPFGERVSLRKGAPGVWYCAAHWPVVGPQASEAS